MTAVYNTIGIRIYPAGTDDEANWTPETPAPAWQMVSDGYSVPSVFIQLQTGGPVRVCVSSNQDQTGQPIIQGSDGEPFDYPVGIVMQSGGLTELAVDDMAGCSVYACCADGDSEFLVVLTRGTEL